MRACAREIETKRGTQGLATETIERAFSISIRSLARRCILSLQQDNDQSVSVDHTHERSIRLESKRSGRARALSLCAIDHLEVSRLNRIDRGRHIFTRRPKVNIVAIAVKLNGTKR